MNSKMARATLKNVDPEYLISNLRSEVGDIIEAWTLMREYYVASSQMMTDNIQEDLKNEHLNKMNILKIKLNDEIVSKLSELGYKRYGTVNFHFAADKMKVLKEETKQFENYLKENKFRDKRNEYISHKVLSPTFDSGKGPHIIKYKEIVKGITMAIILMKKFDFVFYGPKIEAQWIKMRKKRYQYRMPAKIGYILLPHIN